MAARDQRPALLARAVRAHATAQRSKAAARSAHRAYREALMKAASGGVTKAELAREIGSGESRVRQLINQARAESELG